MRLSSTGRLAGLFLVFPLTAAGQDQSGTVQPAGVSPIASFYVRAHVDSPNMNQGIAFVSRREPLIVGGWAFECGSGLQPSTQRVGDLALSLTDVTGTSPAFTVKTYNAAGARPDVGLAYKGNCPALGANAGFSIVVDLSQVPPGMYQLKVLADAFDYAGRYAWYVPQGITIVITD